jgi:glycerol-3-phosphate O-acyltransferase
VHLTRDETNGVPVGIRRERPAEQEGSARRIALVRARTSTERRLIERWAQDQTAVELIDLDDPVLACEFESGESDDPLVGPVQVTWLPRERDGQRRVLATDLLALTHPLRPWPLVQARIAKREPDRARVIAGEPASVSELRRRFAKETGGGSGDALAEFVRRQAILAGDRAERAVIGDRYKVPRLVAEQITASARFRNEVARLAERLERPFDTVLANAESCLRELAAVQSPVAIDLFRFVLGPMHARAWTVETDVDSLERLRDLNRASALVFLPSHRSYVDPLVLGEVLHRHDFPRNHLLGGDNMSFFPIGPLGRRAGVIFIRRNFGDDQIYKLAVREFLGYVVSKRFNIEWYIEGGRSRTGKLRPPRYGLLHYLVRAIEDGRSEDVQLVPVSISYEYMQEVGAIAEEHGGRAKRREGFMWLLEYIRAQRRHVGAARVVFGEPFSLRAALTDAGEGPAQLEKVAFAVAEGINRATPVTASSLVTYALLGARERALTLDEVCRVTGPLLQYAQRRAIPGPVVELHSPQRVREALDALVEAGVAETDDGGPEQVWRVIHGGHHEAAFFRNGAVHWFVSRAILELALLPRGGGELDEPALEAGFSDALALRDLLKFEFFFLPKARFLEELTLELSIIAPDGYEGRSAAAILDAAPMLLADRVLRSFIEAQLVVAQLLATSDPGRPFDLDSFLSKCLALGRHLLLRGRIASPDSVSRELYSGAVKLAANRGLCDPGDEELSRRRHAWLEEVQELSDRLTQLAALDSTKLEGVLDVRPR